MTSVDPENPEALKEEPEELKEARKMAEQALQGQGEHFGGSEKYRQEVVEDATGTYVCLEIPSPRIWELRASGAWMGQPKSVLVMDGKTAKELLERLTFLRDKGAIG